MEKFANFGDEVTEGWSSVRVEKERVERGGRVDGGRRAGRIEVSCI